MQKYTKEILLLLGESVVSHWSKNGRGKEYQYLTLASLRKKLGTGENGRSLANSLHYLNKRKYISYIGNTAERKLALTTKGAMQYVKYCSLVSTIKYSEDKQTLVSVEVPEKKRELRDLLRRRLLESGFELGGRGVYLSRHKLSSNFSFLVKVFGLEDHVHWGEYRRLG